MSWPYAAPSLLVYYQSVKNVSDLLIQPLVALLAQGHAPVLSIRSAHITHASRWLATQIVRIGRVPVSEWIEPVKVFLEVLWSWHGDTKVRNVSDFVLAVDNYSSLSSVSNLSRTFLMV